jgi:hypothetical protein
MWPGGTGPVLPYEDQAAKDSRIKIRPSQAGGRGSQDPEPKTRETLARCQFRRPS